MSYPKMALVLSTHVYVVLDWTCFRLNVRVGTAVVSNVTWIVGKWCLLIAGVIGLMDGICSPVTGRGYSSLIWKQERHKYVYLFVCMYFEHWEWLLTNYFFLPWKDVRFRDIVRNIQHSRDYKMNYLRYSYGETFVIIFGWWFLPYHQPRDLQSPLQWEIQ
jgi:hypothetical protein